MKILAIGATGFIGSQAVRLLLEAGHRVAVLHRGEKPGDLPDEVQRIQGDREALTGLRPECTHDLFHQDRYMRACRGFALGAQMLVQLREFVRVLFLVFLAVFFGVSP